VFKWREVGSVSCAFWAAMLGDQAVHLVGQDSGLTARNQPHGEVTAIVQAPDRSRGDVQTPRDPGQRNPQASSLELHEPPKKNCPIRLAYAMLGRIVPRMKSCSFLPGGDMVPPARSVGQNE
jgi:hypothetical protein